MISPALDRVRHFNCEVWNAQMGSPCAKQCKECAQAEADDLGLDDEPITGDEWS